MGRWLPFLHCRRIKALQLAAGEPTPGALLTGERTPLSDDSVIGTVRGGDVFQCFFRFGLPWTRGASINTYHHITGGASIRSSSAAPGSLLGTVWGQPKRT
jgi:hypothetical protein